VSLPRSRAALALGLALLVLVAYEGVRRCGFVSFDDDVFVYANPYVRQGLTWAGLRWALAADLLFESVAGSFKERAIALVLSGTGSDGSMGVQAIKKMGGTVLAQDESSSEFFGMPYAAIQTGCVDFVLSLTEIPGALVTLVQTGGMDERRT